MKILSALFAAMAMACATPALCKENFHIGGRTTYTGQAEHSTPGGPTIVVRPFHRYQWPGVYFETRFKGQAIDISTTDGYSRYRLLIDNNAPVIIDRPANVAFPYHVTSLKAGWHTLRLEKLSESQGEPAAFLGFDLPNGQFGDLPVRTRQIEFIGDSYTVGYGNTSGKRQCTPEELRLSTDTQQAYGPLTAKHFNADYQINAFSGRGIVRNYDGFAGDSLPELYPYSLYDKSERYEDAAWKPQVIVIGLGGNDFSTPVKPGEKWPDDAALRADYENTFVAFVKALRAKNPQAFFLLTMYEGPTVAEEVIKVAARLKADGETRIDTLGLDGFGLNGCDWHLDTTDDKRIAEQLTGYFEAHAELWQGR